MVPRWMVWPDQAVYAVDGPVWGTNCDKGEPTMAPWMAWQKVPQVVWGDHQWQP